VFNLQLGIYGYNVGMKIRVIRSRRRRKTASARIEQGTMLVFVPQHLEGEGLNSIIEGFRVKFEERRKKSELNAGQLMELAERLNKKYFSGGLLIRSVEYTDRKNKEFGSCDYAKKAIRLSWRLKKMPPWVRDYVMVHELAHLAEPNHSKNFWRLVSRYKLAERAQGYLIAASRYGS